MVVAMLRLDLLLIEDVLNADHYAEGEHCILSPLPATFVSPYSTSSQQAFTDSASY